ncbi:hypothetical protein SAI_1980, partial [Streptococcus agalactiae H36B]
LPNVFFLILSLISYFKQEYPIFGPLSKKAAGGK